jgi:Tfp pilus assembly protein PilX
MRQLAGRARSARRGERGIALLSVIGVLAVLLVLGAMVASGSRVESVLAGVSNQKARAFAAADAGLGYGLADSNNFVQLGTRCTDLQEAGITIAADVCVKYDHEGPPPTSIRVSALRFKAFHFNMDSTGEAPTDAKSALEMEAARLGPAQ